MLLYTITLYNNLILMCKLKIFFYFSEGGKRLQLDHALKIKDLTIKFKTENGKLPAVEDINLNVKQGEIMCIVGESGSGKTVSSLSIMQILPPVAKVTSGELFFENNDLLKLGKKEMGKIRGNEISMIFQDAMSSLDPLFSCGHQIVETIR